MIIVLSLFYPILNDDDNNDYEDNDDEKTSIWIVVWIPLFILWCRYKHKHDYVVKKFTIKPDGYEFSPTTKHRGWECVCVCPSPCLTIPDSVSTSL